METVLWAIGLPLLLFFVALGVGTGFAMTDSESAGFLFAKLCFIAATIDVIGFAVYWAVGSRQGLPWNFIVPTVAALIAVPSLVGGLQWIDGVEIALSKRLVPGNGPTPPMPEGCDAPDNALIVWFGTNVRWSANTDIPLKVIEMAGQPILVADRDAKTGDILIKVLRVFDDRGNSIARIDEEEFWVENSSRRKRPNPSTLIVYDHADEEVLNINYVNRNVITVKGIFRHPKLSESLIITDDAMVQMPNDLRVTRSCHKGGSGAFIVIGGRSPRSGTRR